MHTLPLMKRRFLCVWNMKKFCFLVKVLRFQLDFSCFCSFCWVFGISLKSCWGFSLNLNKFNEFLKFKFSISFKSFFSSLFYSISFHTKANFFIQNVQSHSIHTYHTCFFLWIKLFIAKRDCDKKSFFRIWMQIFLLTFVCYLAHLDVWFLMLQMWWKSERVERNFMMNQKKNCRIFKLFAE